MEFANYFSSFYHSYNQKQSLNTKDVFNEPVLAYFIAWYFLPCLATVEIQDNQ
jgi:hypothetical protein